MIIGPGIIPRLIERFHRAIVAFMLLFFFLTCYDAALRNSPTYDEPDWIASGYYYLKYGKIRFDRIHPPIYQAFLTLPLLLFDAKFPFKEHPCGINNTCHELEGFYIGTQFLYRHSDAHLIFMLTRLMVILLSVCFAYVVYVWAKNLFGLYSGLTALLLYICCPNIIANSILVTADLPFAFFATVMLYFLWRYLNTFQWRDILLSGLFLGICFSGRPNTLFFLPFIFLMVAIRYTYLYRQFHPAPAPLYFDIPPKPTRRPFKPHLIKGIAAMVLLGVVSLLVINTLFRWDHSFETLAQQPLKSAEFSRLPALFKAIPLPIPKDYVLGLDEYLHNQVLYKDLGNFLFGRYDFAKWLYYPSAFLVKTPLSIFLLMLCLGLSFFLYKRAWHFKPYAFLLLAFGIYFLICIAFFRGRLLGIRYILVLYPLLYLLLSACINFKIRSLRWAVTLALVGHVFAFWQIAPHYLAYFNELVGGPKNGYKYLVDSNLDWGQDLFNLKIYMNKNKIDRINLHYFGLVHYAGTIPLDYYGIRYYADTLNNENYQGLKADQYWAVSATHLQGTYLQNKNHYKWLRDRTPEAKIGYSIFVYPPLIRKK